MAEAAPQPQSRKLSPGRGFEVRMGAQDDVHVSVHTRGLELIQNPMLNKGSAFPQKERKAFGLEGLLPPHVATMEEQLRRVYDNVRSKPDPLAKYVYLRGLQDRNEILFYALLAEHTEELMPIVYTPTVGEGCRRYSRVYERPRGLFLTADNVDRMASMVPNLPSPKVKLIVATDGQGILGIGDQGVGGMGIPIGKLSLYVLGAGIHPYSTLPVMLDVGTNDDVKREDPVYLGLRQKRLTGDAYLDTIDRFVAQCAEHFPGVLIQWEDFSKQNAFTVLDRHREKVCSFNDDIQGTGAVALAGILAAMRMLKRSIRDQQVVIYGAGAGGVGIAREIVHGMVREGASEGGARRDRIWMLDSRGLLVADRDGLDPYKKEIATPRAAVEGWQLRDPNAIGLLDVIRNVKPEILIGTSGSAGDFSEAVARAMAEGTDRPLIFPMSNPTANSEAVPADLYRWTEGRCIVATGSPFDDVVWDGRRYRIGQGNNAFIFPGLGLGTIVTHARAVTDAMITDAAFTFAEQVPAADLEAGCLYPRIRELRDVSHAVAVAVARRAIADGVGDDPFGGEDLPAALRRRMWEPRYVPFVAE